MRRTILIVIGLIMLWSLIGVAIYQYNDRPTPQHVETLQDAQKARRKAEQTLKEHDAVNAVVVKNANNQIVTLNGQKATLCAQIKAAKLVQPLCP